MKRSSDSRRVTPAPIPYPRASRTAVTLVAVCAVLALAACQSSVGARPAGGDGDLHTVGCRTGGVASRIAHGDWAVSSVTSVSKILEEQVGAPPRHIGYLVGRDYRETRGGPVFRMYEVTRLNRRDKIGFIDQVGRAFRYVPQRNAGFEVVDEGVGTLENSAGAIFQTSRPILLERTSERRLAFEALDTNGDGVLAEAELEGRGDRLQRADTNRDGQVDFEEFNRLDTL